MPGHGGGSSREQLVVVIPAKDEAASVGSVVTESLRFASQVLVVDGSSKDGTAAAAERAGARVIQDRGRGKGLAIRRALSELEAEVTVFIDADGSHDPEDIPRLVEPILSGRADHVSGSRLLGGSSELHGGFDEWARLAGSSFITACINWRYHVRLSDSQNGFRAIRTDVLKRLRLRARHTTIEQEMIVETLRRGARMAEVPAHEYARKAGHSKISVWRHGPGYLLSLLRLMC